jgi:uncharacterized protein (DUF2236 family)
VSGVLPDPEEYAALTPRPGSPVWSAFNDVRMLTTSGYATLLQVAHPTVGHGVHEYSSFVKDPWGRLLRTLDYVHGTVYGGPELAGSIGRRVREMHRTIRGTKPDGERYSAMEPDAFAWVHATLAQAIFEGRRVFATPMTLRERQGFWDEWRRAGRLIGVRERDLPAAVTDFDAYVTRTIAETLEWTPAIPEVMATLGHAKRPEVRGLPPALWRVLRVPMGAQLRVTTVGLLPPELRERLELPFGGTDRAAFRALAASSRASGPLLRGALAEFGPAYLRWRHEALARGDVAGRAPAARPAAAL